MHSWFFLNYQVGELGSSVRHSCCLDGSCEWTGAFGRLAIKKPIPFGICLSSSTTGSKEMKSKFSTDNRAKETFLQVVLEKKSTDDNRFQEILNGM